MFYRTTAVSYLKGCFQDLLYYRFKSPAVFEGLFHSVHDGTDLEDDHATYDNGPGGSCL